MSRTEKHYFRLKEIEVDNIEDWAKKKCQEIKPELQEPYSNWINTFYYYIDVENQNYKILNGKLYEVIQHVDLSDDDINTVNVRDNGTIEIFTEFYNGGCSLDEALEYNLNKLK